MDVLRMPRIPRILKTSSVCPSCGSMNFYSSGKEAFCNKCSLVILED